MGLNTVEVLVLLVMCLHARHISRDRYLAIKCCHHETKSGGMMML